MTPGMAAKDGSSSGGCPVMHGKGGESGGKPSGLMGIFGGSRRAADASTPAGSKPEPAASGGCPVMHGGKPPPAASTAAPPAAPGATAPHGADATEEKIYNAYGEEVDPRNQMPAGNQEPWPGQTRRLSTERVRTPPPSPLTPHSSPAHPGCCVGAGAVGHPEDGQRRHLELSVAADVLQRSEAQRQRR